MTLSRLDHIARRTVITGCAVVMWWSASYIYLARSANLPEGLYIYFNGVGRNNVGECFSSKQLTCTTIFIVAELRLAKATYTPFVCRIELIS